MKYAKRPVIAAPFSRVLGGGAEIVLHAAAVQASAEIYMGLVEVGVGVLPAAGGCKEMLLRVGDVRAIAGADRTGEGFVERGGSAATRIFARIGPDQFEPGSADRRCEDDGSGDRSRLCAAGAATGESGRRGCVRAVEARDLEL